MEKKKKSELPHVDIGCVGDVDDDECPEGYVKEKVEASTEVDGTVYEGHAFVFRPNTWDALMSLGKKYIVEMYFDQWRIVTQGPIRRKIQDKVASTCPTSEPKKKTRGGSYREFIFTE